MTGHDPEIEELRDKVHCAVVLERTPPPWKLDRKESTRSSLKYRRGKGEILIVSHAGRGWWDPTSDAKGDVFGLVQRLEPTLSFGHVRKRLREFAGLSPRFPPDDRAGCRNSPDRTVAERWAERKAVWPNSPAWRYLARKRSLPSAIIEAATAADVLREGPGASAWFPHLGLHGVVAHVDVRGPTYKGSLTGGAKSLFRLPPKGPSLPRLILAEAAIDALSVAAIESLREDTLYAATGGGMGPGTIAALEALLAGIAMLPGAFLFDRGRRLERRFARTIGNDRIEAMTLLDATPAALGAGSRALVLLRSRRRPDLLNPDPQAWTDDDLAAGLSCTMVEAFGIESNPLLDDPLSPNEFARWKPCPPRVSQHLFMEHFRARSRVAIQRVADPNARLRKRIEPFCDAILTPSVLGLSLAHIAFA